MNNLDYDKAKIIDKRDFLRIYWSILKQNQLIMFAFLPNIDFNLTTIKISLSLISLSLYFTINCFFFDDESMHKIYIELGKYKFINQLPKTIYSCFISSTINFLLRITSLSGKNILLIKKQNTLENIETNTSIALILLLALFSGHILITPAVSIFVALILIKGGTYEKTNKK
jgi:hypothetical protein